MAGCSFWLFSAASMFRSSLIEKGIDRTAQNALPKVEPN